MNIAKREVGALLASVISDMKPGTELCSVSLADWTLSTVTQTGSWTAIVFEAGGKTDWQTFDRDLTIAPTQGSVIIEFEDTSRSVATPTDPVLVPVGTSARYVPRKQARGLFLFIPPIIDTADE